MKGSFDADEKSSAGRYRFGFNGQEQDNEIYGDGGSYTAEFWQYDPRLGRRWNVDPVVKEWESGYAVLYNSPIVFIDEKGDNPITAFVIGAFTEYASMVGAKMLFEGMSFTDANKSLTWKDGIKIGLSGTTTAALGALDGGTVKFGSWIAKPTNQKIIKKLLSVGITALESSLKQFIDDKDFSLNDVLIDVLADVGMGYLFKSNHLDTKIKQTENNLKVAEKRVEDLSTRRSPNEKLINKAEEKVQKLKNDAKFYETVAVIKETSQQSSSKAASELLKK
ncbi:MAG TPA: hypothetical protein VLZ75_13265 [Chitinophagales bacterium]|nr:hypothetical protein [Chitinophagales bacterium]